MHSEEDSSIHTDVGEDLPVNVNATTSANSTPQRPKLKKLKVKLNRGRPKLKESLQDTRKRSFRKRTAQFKWISRTKDDEDEFIRSALVRCSVCKHHPLLTSNSTTNLYDHVNGKTHQAGLSSVRKHPAISSPIFQSPISTSSSEALSKHRRLRRLFLATYMTMACKNTMERVYSSEMVTIGQWVFFEIL